MREPSISDNLPNAQSFRAPILTSGLGLSHNLDEVAVVGADGSRGTEHDDLLIVSRCILHCSLFFVVFLCFDFDLNL